MANRVNSSGTLRMSTFFDVFGQPPGKNLGAYRVSETYGHLSDLALDEGIPKSGTIRFNDFYSKRVNVIVDYYTIPNFTTRVTARNRFNENGYSIVGGFRSTISTGNGNSSGARVILNLNKVIGSAKGDIRTVALKTGTWESDTKLELDIGSAGGLIGAGGDGGTGGSTSQNGTNGTSALGIQYPTEVRNRGYIQGGMGGGGGGGFGRGRRCGRTQRGCDECSKNTSYSAGGGGGGAGYPVGSGTQRGGNGTLISGGAGGSPILAALANNSRGRSCRRRAHPGAGGAGGSVATTSGQGGQAGFSDWANEEAPFYYTAGGSNWGGPGGAAGANGYSIILGSGSTGSTILDISPGTRAGGTVSENIL